MLLFALWSILLLGTLAGVGYSHYIYRVRHNEYYERLKVQEQNKTKSIVERGPHGFYSLPIAGLLVVYLLVSVFLIV